MSIRAVVVVGASAGGVEALRAFVSGFSPNPPAEVLTTGSDGAGRGGP
jgi:chemotaxis response regulator CheB